MTTETAPTTSTAIVVDTGTDQLLAERDGHVLTLTLNRPERLNAISGPMMSNLARLLKEANRDPEVRAVILTGKHSHLNGFRQNGNRFDGNFKWLLVYNRFQWIVPCVLLMMNCLFSADDFRRNYRLRFRFCL